MFTNKERKTFGELTREQRLILKGYFYEYGTIEFICLNSGLERTAYSTEWRGNKVYFIPDEKTKIDWSYIHPDYKFYARDKDGTHTLHKERPRQASEYFRSDAFDDLFQGPIILEKIVKVGDEPWEESLIERPRGE